MVCLAASRLNLIACVEQRSTGRPPSAASIELAAGRSRRSPGGGRPRPRAHVPVYTRAPLSSIFRVVVTRLVVATGHAVGSGSGQERAAERQADSSISITSLDTAAARVQSSGGDGVVYGLRGPRPTGTRTPVGWIILEKPGDEPTLGPNEKESVHRLVVLTSGSKTSLDTGRPSMPMIGARWA